jgi:hypothetical protein
MFPLTLSLSPKGRGEGEGADLIVITEKKMFTNKNKTIDKF